MMARGSKTGAMRSMPKREEVPIPFMSLPIGLYLPGIKKQEDCLLDERNLL
jgi:hypothetical protein